MTFLELLLVVLAATVPLSTGRPLPARLSLLAPQWGCTVRGALLCCDHLSLAEECGSIEDASAEGPSCVKMESVWLDTPTPCLRCGKHKECVPSEPTINDHRVSRLKRSAASAHTDLPPGNTSYFTIIAVVIVTTTTSVFLLVLCAGGGTKAYDMEPEGGEVPPQREQEVEASRGRVQKNEEEEEVQEAEIEIGDQPPVEVVADGQHEEAPANQLAEQEPGDDEDDPAYDHVHRPVGNHDDPQQGVAEDVGGVKVSYGRVSRHPGQPPYASVGEVLPSNEVATGDEESSDQVAQETDRADYAEVQSRGNGKPVGAAGGGAPSKDYDVVGYDSVPGAGPGTASQEDRYDVVQPSTTGGAGGGVEEQAYAVVRLSSSLPTSGEEPAGGGAGEVAPQLPPMRTRQQSSSEDDPVVSGAERSSTLSSLSSKRDVRDKSKPSKDHPKEKGKGFPGLFRHRSATVAVPSKSKPNPDEPVKQGPPLPPNHPQPSRGFPLQGRPAQAVPTDEVEDLYDEPFDSAPSGRPRKVSSSVGPKEVTAKGNPLPRNISGSVSPSSKGFPQTPLPDIPHPSDEPDPNYESVTSTMKRVAMETPKPLDEEETPYDTVPSDLSKSPRKPPPKADDDSEEETPYDIVDRTKVKSGVSVVVSQGGVSKDEEETPYDTVVSIPGTSIPVRVGLQATMDKKTSSGSEDPYSAVGSKSDVNPYSTVNKVKQAEPSPLPSGGEDPYSMPVDNVDTPHDDHGYAVVPEEYKRNRTMSKGAGPPKNRKPKLSSLQEATYATVDNEGVSPTPPISPIKDQEIIKEFCPPQTPPPLSNSPENLQTTATLPDSCHGDMPEVHQLTVSGSEGVICPPT